MGTNYYARILPSHSRKKKLKRFIDENNWDKIQDMVQLMYGRSTEYETGAEIHLGKRSAGWKFLFNANDEKYYDLNRESLFKFLNKKNVIIYDEYFDGKTFEYSDDPDKTGKHSLWTPTQFMDMALNWGYNEDKLGWDGKTYEEWELSQKNRNYCGYKRYGDPYESKWREKGYKPEYYNFYSDNMRWATCCEFS